MTRAPESIGPVSPRTNRGRATLGVLALAVVVVAFQGDGAYAGSTCLGGKDRCVRRMLRGLMRCHISAERVGRTLNARCVQGVMAQYDGGAAPETGCFRRLETRHDLCAGGANAGETCAADSECPGGTCVYGCATFGDAADVQGKIESFVTDVVSDLDPAYPAASRSLCAAGKKDCVVRKTTALLRCHQKAVDGDRGAHLAACLREVRERYDEGNNACFRRVEKRYGDCPQARDANAIDDRIDSFVQDVLCGLGYETLDCPVCGDGQKTGSEPCDPSDPTPANQVCENSGNGLEVCTGCVCQCPSHFDFIADADSPDSLFDAGWTGIFHDQRLVSGAKVTVTVTGCQHAHKPCGICSFSGPIPNIAAGAGDIDDHRCTNDTSITCSDDTPCTGGGGTCQFYAGSYLPLAGGGIGVCVAAQVSGPITGTADVGTGTAAAILTFNAHVFIGQVDRPCPRCVGDGTPNDSVAGGTCDAGARSALACDANGTSPLAVFGSTSLDCPPNGSDSTGILTIPITTSTGSESRTLTAASPNCRATGFTSSKCFCDTCNDLDATACASNADCVAVGATICGGKRCQSGGNAGSPCNVASECPGGVCGIPGTPTQPNACDDATCTPTSGDEGECAAGPTDVFCQPNAIMVGCLGQADCDAVGIRSCQGGANDGTLCSSDSECPGGNVCSGLNAGDTNTGCCLDLCGGSQVRECFTDNGVLGQSLVATGASEVPVFELSHPTFAALSCLQPTSSPSQNNAAGLPGPLRLTIHGLGRGLP